MKLKEYKQFKAVLDDPELSSFSEYTFKGRYWICDGEKGKYRNYVIDLLPVNGAIHNLGGVFQVIFEVDSYPACYLHASGLKISITIV